MGDQEEYRKKILDHHIDEKFAEIFFIAKEEYDIPAKTEEEELLYDFLDKFKLKLKKKCKAHLKGD